MSCRPSEIMGIEDLYSAFCFDEACAYIVKQIEDGKEPIFKEKKKDKEGKEVPKSYKRASELYSKYNNVKINS